MIITTAIVVIVIVIAIIVVIMTTIDTIIVIRIESATGPMKTMTTTMRKITTEIIAGETYHPAGMSIVTDTAAVVDRGPAVVNAITMTVVVAETTTQGNTDRPCHHLTPAVVTVCIGGSRTKNSNIDSVKTDSSTLQHHNCHLDQHSVDSDNMRWRIRPSLHCHRQRLDLGGRLLIGIMKHHCMALEVGHMV
jgi:hypothetical protein